MPIADVSPYVMIGGHVLLNLPTGDFKLIARETSNALKLNTRFFLILRR